MKKFFQNRLVQALIVIVAISLGSGVYFYFHSRAAERINSMDDSLNRGLAGYWQFDNGSGTNATDSSGNGNTLALTGSPAWTTGQINGALDLSGSGQYGSVADPASGVLDFADSTDFSLSGWFNRDTFAADHTILAKKNDQITNQGYVLWVDNNGSTDTLIFEASDGVDTYQMASSTQFNTTGWHNFVVTWDDSVGMNMYIDGHLDNGATSGTFANVNSLANTRAFRAGAESDAGVPFDGKLDDIRIYNRVLSIDEIARLYQGGSFANPEANLAGYWNMEGPTINGTTLLDNSGKRHNGTLTGTTRVPGKFGQGLSFNGGTDKITANLNLSTIETVTVSFWLRANSWTADQSVLDILWTSASITVLNVISNTWCFSGNGQVKIVERTNSGDNYRCYSSPSTGVWHHYAIVIDISQPADGEIAAFYVDGVAQTATSVSETMDNTAGYPSDAVLTIMTSTAGTLDDVRVYTQTLSASQVTQLYQTGATMMINTNQNAHLTDGLLGLWSFNGSEMLQNGGAQYRSSNTRNYASRTNTTLTAPSNIQNGDLLIIIFDIGASSSPPTPTPPSGFAVLPTFSSPITMVENGNIFTVNLYAWYKFANNESGNYIVTHATASTQGYIVAVNGADQTTPFSPNPTQNTSSTGSTTTALGLTTPRDNSWVMFVSSDWGNTQNNLSVPTGSTPTFTKRMGATLESPSILFVADGVKGAAGATGNKSITNNSTSSTPWAGVLISVQPPITSSVYDRTSSIVGHSGQALSFNGTNSSVTVGASYNSVKTVSFWTKPSSTTQSIIDLNGTQTVDIFAGTVRGNNFTTPTVYVDGVQTTTFPDTGWHHVVVTTDTGINASSLVLGKISSTYYSGVLDEVRLYSRALGASEIASLYNFGR